MKELKKYYRQISSWLPCGGQPKKQLMRRMTTTVEGYLHENPAADFAAIQAHFGTPQQIATAFVDEMGTEELLQKLRIRNRILKTIAILASTLVILWTLFLTVALINEFNNSGGYLTEEIIIPTEVCK